MPPRSTDEEGAFEDHVAFVMSTFGFSREEAVAVAEGRMIPDATSDPRVAAAVFNVPIEEARRRLDAGESFVIRDKIVPRRTGP